MLPYPYDPPKSGRLRLLSFNSSLLPATKVYPRAKRSARRLNWRKCLTALVSTCLFCWILFEFVLGVQLFGSVANKKTSLRWTLYDSTLEHEDIFTAMLKEMTRYVRENRQNLRVYKDSFGTGYFEILQAVWSGAYLQTSDFLSKHEINDIDVLVLTSGTTDLTALLPICEERRKLHIVLVINTPEELNPHHTVVGGITPYPEDVIQVLIAMAQRGQLTFVALNRWSKDSILRRLKAQDPELDMGTNWKSFVDVVVPLPDLSALRSKRDYWQPRHFDNLGLVLGNAHESSSIALHEEMYLQNLFTQIEIAILRQPGFWGYRLGESDSDDAPKPFQVLVGKRGQRRRPLHLHLFANDPTRHEFTESQTVIPERLKEVVVLHTTPQRDWKEYYRALSTMDVILPGHNVSVSATVPLAVSLRVPSMFTMPQLSVHPYLSMPAYILYPSDMSVIKAIELLRDSHDPNGYMAPEARVWDKFDFDANWRDLESKIRVQNENCWKGVLSRRKLMNKGFWW